jgi:membrane fusion protein (multidrug efflux system)
MSEPSSSPPARGKKSLVIILSIIAIGGGITLWQVLAHRGLESTDNAQLEAEIVGIPTRIGGTVTEVLVRDNQRVQAGDVLARLDDAPLKAKLAQAEAAVAAAEASAAAADLDARVATRNASGNLDVAEATKATVESAAKTAKTGLREAQAAVRAAEAAASQARSDKDRAENLRQGGVLTEADLQAAVTRASVAAANLEAARARLDNVRASLDQAEVRIGEASARVDQTNDLATLEALAKARADAAHAQVGVAKAARDVAALDLGYTTIRAPQAGIVSKKTVAVGQVLAAGQSVAQLVTDGLWVGANFKETQVAAMRPGQRVKVEVDAFPGVEVVGEVESMAGATGARFSLLPPDNATGNFTKVVQRVPVRVKLVGLPSDVPLRAGLSVSITVDTRATTPRAAETARVD